MVLTGDCRGTELIHEVGHNLNKFAYGGNYTDQNPFTAGQTWLAAYDNDTAVPDSYAQTSQSENHSQHTVIAVYDLNVKGGIAAVEPNWIAIYNQYTAIEMGLGTKLKPGGKCERRFQNTELVNIGSKRDLTPPVRRLAYPKIEVIETRSDNTVRECDHDHDH
jgi:hypothetical protein